MSATSDDGCGRDRFAIPGCDGESRRRRSNRLGISQANGPQPDDTLESRRGM